MKPRMKNHFRAHQLSVWLRLIPELHRAGMEDVMLRHNLFRNHDDADLYEGVVRPDPLSRRAPQRATVNRFTANGTVAEVVQSLTTTGRPQWPAESTTCVPPPARGGPNAAAANASTATTAEDALATLGAAGYAAYVTALHVTIALGVSLLVLNGLLLVIICYQKDRFKCLQQQQQQQQQTGGGSGGGGDGGQEAGGGGGDSHAQKIAATAVRYKAGAAVIPDDRPPADKVGGGYDHHQHHNHHHHHQQQQQQQQQQVDAVTVDMEQRQLHHHHHHHHLQQQQQQQQYHHHQQTGIGAVRTTTGGGHDMTFPRAAVKQPSGRMLHEQHVVHMQGGPPNGSLLVHGTLPKPPPPPRSAVQQQSQESQPLLVQQGVGLGQIPKAGGTLKMPVAAMSEMRV